MSQYSQYINDIYNFLTTNPYTLMGIGGVIGNKADGIVNKTWNFATFLLSKKPENLSLLKEIKSGKLDRKEEFKNIIEVEIVNQNKEEELKEILKEIKSLNIQGDLVMGNKTKFRDNSKQLNIQGNYIENQHLSNSKM